MHKLRLNKRAANSVVEYTIILMAVATAFTIMNTYIKRSFQAGLKDMTDGFIGSGNSMQAADANPTAITTSNQTTNSNSTFTDQMFLGGSREATALDVSNMSGNTNITDSISGQANPAGTGGGGGGSQGVTTTSTNKTTSGNGG